MISGFSLATVNVAEIVLWAAVGVKSFNLFFAGVLASLNMGGSNYGQLARRTGPHITARARLNTFGHNERLRMKHAQAVTKQLELKKAM